MEATQNTKSSTENTLNLDFERHATFEQAMSAASDEERQRLQDGIDYIGERSASKEIEKLNSMASWWCTVNGEVFYLLVTPGEGLSLLNGVNLTFSVMDDVPFLVFQISSNAKKAGIMRSEQGDPVLLDRDMKMRKHYAKLGIIVTTHAFN